MPVSEAKVNEIKGLLNEGKSSNQIQKIVKLRRTTVQGIVRSFTGRKKYSFIKPSLNGGTVNQLKQLYKEAYPKSMIRKLAHEMNGNASYKQIDKELKRMDQDKKLVKIRKNTHKLIAVKNKEYRNKYGISYFEDDKEHVISYFRDRTDGKYYHDVNEHYFEDVDFAKLRELSGYT